MCTSPDPPEPLPTSRVLPSMEVRGTSLIIRVHRLHVHDWATWPHRLLRTIFANFYCVFRMSAIPTKSASTTSSRNVWPRWTSCGLPRTALVATKLADLCLLLMCVFWKTVEQPAGYVHRRYSETTHALPFMALGHFLFPSFFC